LAKISWSFLSSVAFVAEKNGAGDTANCSGRDVESGIEKALFAWKIATHRPKMEH
jgi:hypothetical protein